MSSWSLSRVSGGYAEFTPLHAAAAAPAARLAMNFADNSATCRGVPRALLRRKKKLPDQPAGAYKIRIKPLINFTIL
jgi:hypothetical protein